MPTKNRESFVAKVMAGKERVYHLICGQPDARVWYFIKIAPPKEKAFLNALKGTEIFHPDQFGEVLHWGYGKPSDALKKEMKAQFKINYKDE